MNNRFARSLAAVCCLFSSIGAYAAAPVGRTVGQFSVGPTGDGQYTIPIFAPPGPRGIQPNISLFYDSRSPIGPLGLGWSIAGLGQITRCNKTVAQDTTAAPVALAATDGYCINGKRLRLTSTGNYGEAGSTYQTEIADFSQITAYSSSGITGIGYFIVQGSNGLTYYYGYTDANNNGAGSQVIAANFTPSTAITWLLSKVVDRAGNNYVINYTNLNKTLIGTAVPSTIYWTATSASKYAYTMQFNYPNTNPPQSSINKYVGGTNVSNTALLASIEVLYGTTVVKDYFIGYTPSPTTGRDQITSVTECPNSTESSSTCLSPTAITYAEPAAGVSTTTTYTALNSSGTNLTARYDLNGDGIPDLVYYNGTSWYVSFGSASGYGTPVNTGITASAPAFLLGNLNAGPEDGMLADNGGTWWYYTWNGTSFEGVSTGVSYDPTAAGYQLADINGDGLPDLIYLYVTYNSQTGTDTATIDTRLNNTPAGGAVGFSSTLTPAYSLSGVDSGTHLVAPDTQFGRLRHYDFNGDGNDDLVLAAVVGAAGHSSTTIYELITDGATFTPTTITSAGGAVFFVDWNDDKCTDFVNGGTLYISACNGTVPATFPVGTPVAAMDWDGDGRTDLVVQNGTTLGVYLSTGSGISSLITTHLPNASCVYVTMDATGGGFDDLGCWISSGTLTYYLHNGVPDIAIEFEDGYGNYVKPSFVSIAQGSYTQNSVATYPDENYTGSLYVVSNATFSDPSGYAATYSQTYSYYNAWVNTQGRGFDGFGLVGTYDSRNALTDFKYYEQTFPYTGMVYQDILSNGSLYATRETDTPAVTELSTTQNEERYFPYFSATESLQWEFGGTENGDLISTTSSTYSYDSYGNLIASVTGVYDQDPGSPYNGDSWTTTINNTIDIDQSGNESADLAAWCVNLLDETEITYTATINGSNSITRTQQYVPDTNRANCRISQIITEPNNSLYKVTETLTFDNSNGNTGFGNVTVDTVTGVNMPSSPATRVTNLGWSTNGQFVTTKMDPSGATTTWTYSSNQALTFGVPDSMADPNSTKSNPIITSWGYDAFGRKTSEVRPDNTSTTWTWGPCTSNCGSSVYQIAQAIFPTSGGAIRTDTNLYDRIDRITQTSGPTVTGATAYVQTKYWPLGMLYQQSMPYLSGNTEYWQTYNYDVLNRLSSVTRPISSSNSNPQTTSYAYAGRTTVVSDPYGNKTTTITDVKGQLRQTKDAVGYTITRAYDTAESLTGITDSLTNALLTSVTYNYGIRPFLVAGIDADRGAFTNTFDSLGERTSWTDDEGDRFYMTFDALSRLCSFSDFWTKC